MSRKTKEVTTLRSRWVDPSNIERALDPQRNDPHDRSLNPAAFATMTDSEGTWIDLRGFPLDRVTDLHGEWIDFSHARSIMRSHGLAEITIFRCRFRRVRFDHSGTFYEIRGSFEASTFRGIRAREAYLIGQFKDCTFESSNLYAATLLDTFEGCSFLNANLKKANLSESKFVDCDFRGATFERGAALKTRFLRCDFTNVDFKDTFRDSATEFVECKLDGFHFTESTKMFGIDIPTGG